MVYIMVGLFRLGVVMKSHVYTRNIALKLVHGGANS